MTPSLVDICFNFTHSSFRQDEAEVLARAVAAGVETLMVTGSSVEESARCVELAERYPDHLYATVGVHPHLSVEWNASSEAALERMAAHPKVRAIGETGLDYNRDYSPRSAQRHAFTRQAALAVDLGMPLFLHQRDAHADFMSILQEYRDALGNVVVHCFTGSARELEDYLEADLHIGITGWICDERRGRHLHDLVGMIPLNRLMVETDAPYLLPRDLKPSPRGRRNEPSFLPHILQGLAGHLERSPAEIAAATTRTAMTFYGLPTN
ncbi:MAG: TatD family hydrolase [Pseudomonadota bacterium]|nr:TatD family hydrolase [Pseudomonadota bacterium]